MPRGFLVKRYSTSLVNSTLESNPNLAHDEDDGLDAPLPLTKKSRPNVISRYSDEDRSDSSSSEQEPIIGLTDPSNDPVSASRSKKNNIAHHFRNSLLPPLFYRVYTSPQSQLPQEVPPSLTMPTILPSTIPSTGGCPSRERAPSPGILDLRCQPTFISNIPKASKRLPSSAPTSNENQNYNRSLAALMSSQKMSTTSKKRRIEDKEKPPKRHKTIRKLNFDEHKSSPVSGTFIRDSDSEDDLPSAPLNCVRRTGDIDPSLNVVVVTEEARMELAKIENKIGDYICQLCKEKYEDAFGLAQHRCSRIVHVEYRCPECDKVFNCPANLASHRRWHKPRNGMMSNKTESNLEVEKACKVSVTGTASIQNQVSSPDKGTNASPSALSPVHNKSHHHQTDSDLIYECSYCPKKFRRQAYMNKHLHTQHKAGEASIFLEEPKESKGNHFIGIKEVRPVEMDSSNKCPFCQQCFTEKLSLQVHLKTKHSDDIIYCKYCSEIFYTKSGLNSHINEYHSSSSNDHKLKMFQSVRPVSS